MFQVNLSSMLSFQLWHSSLLMFCGTPAALPWPPCTQLCRSSWPSWWGRGTSTGAWRGFTPRCSSRSSTGTFSMSVYNRNLFYVSMIEIYSVSVFITSERTNFLLAVIQQPELNRNLFYASIVKKYSISLFTMSEPSERCSY